MTNRRPKSLKEYMMREFLPEGKKDQYCDLQIMSRGITYQRQQDDWGEGRAHLWHQRENMVSVSSKPRDHSHLQLPWITYALSDLASFAHSISKWNSIASLKMRPNLTLLEIYTLLSRHQRAFSLWMEGSLVLPLTRCLWGQRLGFCCDVYH